MTTTDHRAKPWDGFSEGYTEEELLKLRNHYDEFILYTDNQFNVFFENLRKSGLLENTWVIFTSDHGEMFERGIQGHSTDSMYEPVLRVPLMIFEPGRTKGENIYTPPSAVDILPTLAHHSGNKSPDWAEGNVLPPFTGKSPDENRSVYAVRALETRINDPITRSSTVIVKGGYKLHYYRGYTADGRHGAVGGRSETGNAAAAGFLAAHGSRRPSGMTLKSDSSRAAA